MQNHHKKPHRPGTSVTGVRPQSSRHNHRAVPRRSDSFPFAVLGVVAAIGLLLTAYAFSVKDNGAARKTEYVPPVRTEPVAPPAPLRPPATTSIESTKAAAAARAAEIAAIPAKNSDAAKAVDGAAALNPNREGTPLPFWATKPDGAAKPTTPVPATPPAAPAVPNK